MATETVGRTGRTVCWICNRNDADAGEHKTKRSDLLAVLGEPTQETPLYFHDLKRPNRQVGSLNAKILKSPIRICNECNSARTQPHDRSWETMSEKLRAQQLSIGRWVRANRIFPYCTKRQMTNVQLYFLKLFGCMLCEARAGGHDVPIDLAPFSTAIMEGRPHPEILLQFGKCDGTVGRSNLHCWKSEHGSILAAWLYELDTIAVSVIYSQAGRWDHKAEFWKPGLKRFKIGDFVYSRRSDNPN